MTSRTTMLADLCGSAFARYHHDDERLQAAFWYYALLYAVEGPQA